MRRLRLPRLALMASAIALLAVPVALAATPETPKPGQRIDMKVLLLTSATTDTTATTWEAALKREGVPYDKLVVGTAGVLTDAKLADYAANRAFYQAVVVAPGNIADPACSRRPTWRRSPSSRPASGSAS